MNKLQFFNLVVSEAVKHYKNPVVANSTEAGADLCVVTDCGTLKYLTLENEVMTTILHKVITSSETSEKYQFEVFVISEDGSDIITLPISELTEEVEEGKTVVMLDVLEILVDNNDSSKYLIMSEGEQIFSTSEITMNAGEAEYVYSYKDTELVVEF